jgi:hypothetical protein
MSNTHRNIIKRRSVSERKYSSNSNYDQILKNKTNAIENITSISTKPEIENQKNEVNMK